MIELLQSKSKYSIEVENRGAIADELSLNYNPVILLSHEDINLNPIKSFAKLNLLSHRNLVSSSSFVASVKNGALSDSARIYSVTLYRK